jgi:hypothetical protein
VKAKKPFDVKIDPQIKLIWWWKQKTKLNLYDRWLIFSFNLINTK